MSLYAIKAHNHDPAVGSKVPNEITIRWVDKENHDVFVGRAVEKDGKLVLEISPAVKTKVVQS